jgi:hypothetical protein
MRFIAFPLYENREVIRIQEMTSPLFACEIISGPTESGLYLLEATSAGIELLRKIFGDHYLFMEDE